MKPYLIVGLIALLILLGCSKDRYYCSNGIEVTDPVDCSVDINTQNQDETQVIVDEEANIKTWKNSDVALEIYEKDGEPILAVKNNLRGVIILEEIKLNGKSISIEKGQTLSAGQITGYKGGIINCDDQYDVRISYKDSQTGASHTIDDKGVKLVSNC